MARQKQQVSVLAHLIGADALPTDDAGVTLHYGDGNAVQYQRAIEVLDALGYIGAENTHRHELLGFPQETFEAIEVGPLRLMGPNTVTPMADKYLPPVEKLASRKLEVIPGGGFGAQHLSLVDRDPGDETTAA